MPKTQKPLDANSKLMKDCGAQEPYSWEPEPTDQIRYQMNRGDATAQVVGWVKWHTTRGVFREGKMRRSEWAVNDAGKALTIKHAALDLDWKYQTAINNFHAAEAEGLIRIEKNAKKEPGRIGLCADVPKSRRRKGELNNSVQNHWPAQLVEQIEKLSAVDRKNFEKAHELYRKWCKEIFDEGATEVRKLQAQAEDTIMQTFCLQKQRKNKSRERKTGIRVELSETPDFVHLVQNASCTESKSASVQRENEAHIKETETEHTQNTVGRSVTGPTHLPERTEYSEKAAAISAMLSRVLAGKLKTTPGQRIVTLVLEKLGDASIESLEGRIMLRLNAITSYGMVVSLAADVAAAKDAPATPSAQTKSDRHEQQRDEYFRQRMRQELEAAGKLEKAG